MQEGEEPHPAVVRAHDQTRPDHRADDAHERQVSEPDARREPQREHRHGEDHGGAEVGLHHHEPHTRTEIGRSGTASWRTSSTLVRFRARVAAANTINESLASSDGCTVTGPSWNHREEP